MRKNYKFHCHSQNQLERVLMQYAYLRDFVVPRTFCFYTS